MPIPDQPVMPGFSTALPIEIDDEDSPTPPIVLSDDDDVHDEDGADGENGEFPLDPSVDEGTD